MSLDIVYSQRVPRSGNTRLMIWEDLLQLGINLVQLGINLVQLGTTWKEESWTTTTHPTQSLLQLHDGEIFFTLIFSIT